MTRSEETMDARREDGRDPLTGRERAMRMCDIVSWDWEYLTVADVRADLVSLLVRELALHAPSAVDAAQHIAGNILAGLDGMGRPRGG